MKNKRSLPIQIVVAVMLLLFYSCQSAKEISIKHTYKALRADSVEPVRIISALRPCVTGEIVRGDSTEQQEYFRKLDSIINSYTPSEDQYIHDTVNSVAECTDLVRDYNNLVDDFTKQDRYITGLEAQLKVKPPRVRDTLPVTDTRQVYLLEQERAALQGIIVNLKARIVSQDDDIHDLKKGKRNITYYLIGLIILILAGLYFSVRRK